MQHYSLCNLRGRARKRACSAAPALREMGPSKTLARSGQASQLVEEEPAAEEEDVVAPSASVFACSATAKQWHGAGGRQCLKLSGRWGWGPMQSTQLNRWR